MAAWSVLVALAGVVAAPLWHDHAHGHGEAASAHTHPARSSCTRDHAEGKPASAPTHDPSSPPPDDHDSCAVCVAVHAPTGDGLPSLPLCDVTVVAELLPRLGAERPAVEWVGRDRASRGPPLTRFVG